MAAGRLLADKFTPAMIISDFALSGCNILGRSGYTPLSIRGRSRDSLASARVKLLVNGAEVASATGSNVLGNPITALTWLANELNNNNHMLQAGQLVMTGAAVAYKNVSPGDVITGVILGLENNTEVEIADTVQVLMSE